MFEFVDLDLDLEQIGAGPVTVLDRDEFLERARTLSYPAELVAAGEESCASVAAALSSGSPPFDGSYVAWWQLVS